MTTKLAEAMQLWQACFDDDEAFVRYYFERLAHEDEVYLCRDGGQAVAHIHAPVYRLRSGVGDAFYISGACTLESHRGQGIMYRLMVETLRGEYARGRVAALLIPADEALRSYYARHFGFVTNSYRYETSSLEALPELSSPTAPTAYHYDGTDVSLEGYIYACLGGYALDGVAHSVRQVVGVLGEYRRWGQVLTAVDAEGCLQAVALCRDAGDTYYIDAVLGSAPERIAPLVPEGRVPRLILPHRPIGGGAYMTSPRGMVRLLDLPAYLRHYAEQGGAELSLSWVDDIVPQNTGTYTISGRVVNYSPELRHEPLSAEELVALVAPEYWLSLMHD